MIFRIADDGHAPAAGDDYVSLRHTLCGVIRAFGVDVGAQNTDQIAYVESIKDDDHIYVSQSGQDFSAFMIGDARPSRTLQRTHTGVRVDRYHQPAAQFLGCAQVPYVAHMQQVKAAVAEDDLFAGIAPALGQLGKLLEAENLMCLRQLGLRYGAQ